MGFRVQDGKNLVSAASSDAREKARWASRSNRSSSNARSCIMRVWFEVSGFRFRVQG